MRRILLLFAVALLLLLAAPAAAVMHDNQDRPPSVMHDDVMHDNAPGARQARIIYWTLTERICTDRPAQFVAKLTRHQSGPVKARVTVRWYEGKRLRATGTITTGTMYRNSRVTVVVQGRYTGDMSTLGCLATVRGIG